MKFYLMITGESDHILRTLLDTPKDEISRQEILDLFKKIEDDATKICQEKYELHEVIKFDIMSGNKGCAISLGRQSFKSLDCIRLSITLEFQLSISLLTNRLPVQL